MTENTITAAAYDGDLVSRLRNWRGLHLAHGGRLFDEAAAEIERLRDGAAASRETVCPHVRGTVTQHCSLNFTLTDAEREAVEIVTDWATEHPSEDDVGVIVLRRLLERLQ